MARFRQNVINNVRNNDKKRTNFKKQQNLSRRRNVRSRSRRGGGMHYVETIPISVELGKSVDLMTKLLLNRPRQSNFRIQYIHFVGCGAYDPATSVPSSNMTTSGFFAPSAVQLSIFNASDKSIAASTGPVVFSNLPRNIKIHAPRQNDWLPFAIDDTIVIGRIEATCIGKASTEATQKAYVRGILHILVKFGPETVSNACPALESLNLRLLSSDTVEDVPHGFEELSMSN